MITSAGMRTSGRARLTPVWHAVALVAMFVIASSALALPVGVGYFLANVLRGSDPRDVSRQLEDALLWLNVFVGVGQLFLALGLTAFWMQRIDRGGSLRQFGWDWKSSRAGAALLAGGGLAGAALLLSALTRTFEVLGPAWQTESLGDVLLTDLPGFIVLLALTIIAEEIIFRGYVLWLFEGDSALVFSAVLYAAYRALAWRLFGDTHQQGIGTLLMVTASALVSGLVLASLYSKTRSLWTGIALRGGWALVAGIVFSVAVNGRAVEGLIQTRASGGYWAGGAGGPEAGVLGIALWLVALAVLHFRERKEISI